MLSAQRLEAYAHRLGLPAPLRCGSPDELERLLQAHLQHIPFENLDVLLGLGISLEFDDIFDKLVTRGRGGYCFEHATLFRSVLQSLGHAPRTHLARVRLSASAELITPRTHMLLSLELGGQRHLVDPGFGGPGLRTPMPLDVGEHSDSEARFELRQAVGEWWLYRHGSEELCLYHFPDDEVPPIDVVLGNHYCATHPGSTFRNRLMVQSFDGPVRHTLHNALHTRIEGGARNERRLEDRDELESALLEHFGIEAGGIQKLVVPSHPPWAGETGDHEQVPTS